MMMMMMGELQGQLTVGEQGDVERGHGSVCQISAAGIAEIEVPKALRVVGNGEGFPLPSRLLGLGERRKLPQWGPQAENDFGTF